MGHSEQRTPSARWTPYLTSSRVDQLRVKTVLVQKLAHRSWPFGFFPTK